MTWVWVLQYGIIIMIIIFPHLQVRRVMQFKSPRFSPVCSDGNTGLMKDDTYWFSTEILYLALPTRAGSPQQRMPITVGPFYLTHPVNFPCERKPEYPGKTHDFRQSVDFYSFHMRTGSESHWGSSHWGLNLRPQRWKASALTTWPPKPHDRYLHYY
jgi:hypothetical protein